MEAQITAPPKPRLNDFLRERLYVFNPFLPWIAFMGTSFYVFNLLYLELRLWVPRLVGESIPHISVKISYYSFTSFAKENSMLLYAFFWVIPGVWILYADVSEHSVPSSYAGRYEEWLGLRMLGYLYGKKFGSKIAWVNRKEGDLLPSFLLAQVNFEPNIEAY
jgi:hypothetical protein